MARLDGSYDVLVVGVGSMGAAAARTLAARGLRVLGLETFSPAHDQGSAHGGTRIVRQSYFESPAYVPLLRRAYQGWHELTQESGRDLLRLCGGIYIGDPNSRVFTGSLASARIHGLEHEVLDAAEIATRFPTMRPLEHALGLYEANAGYVRPEETVLANVDLARQHGADLRFCEPVTHWAPTPGGGAEVVTSRGRYGADRLVLAPGAWVSTPAAAAGSDRGRAADLLLARAELHPQGPVPGLRRGPPRLPGGDGRQRGDLRLPDGRRASRRAQARLLPAEPRGNHHTANHRPHNPRRRGRGDGTPCPPAFPHLSGHLVKAATCMYASAPDDAFVLGPLAGTPQVVLACGFSGHGFKFVPVVGEIVADLAQTGTTPHDIALFDVARPALAGTRTS
jgi:sarcosine oxidase